MTIKSLYIKNFRCFESLELDFESLHGLIGENGTGKTAVLEALNLVTSSSYTASKVTEQDFHNKDAGDIFMEIAFDEIFLVRAPDGYVTQDIPCKIVRLDIKRRKQASAGKALSDPFVVEHYAVPIEYSDKTRVVDESKFQTVDSNGKPRRLTVPSSLQKTVKGYKCPRKTSDRDFEFPEKGLGFQYDMMGFPQVFYFDKNREKQSRTGYSTLLNRIANDLNWRFRNKWDKDEVAKLWDAYYNKTVDIVIDPKKGRVLKPLQEKLQEYTGKHFGGLELSLLSIEEPFAKAYFSERDGTNQVEQRGLGSGISILLSYFLLQTVSSWAKDEIIFLIDEPELHLHPQLQQKLFQDFGKSEHQIIYTTQSDSFVDIANWSSITRFTTNRKCLPEKSMLSQTFASKTLEDHLNDIKTYAQHKTIFIRQDNEILFARKCVLVEGPAEKYGLITLAEKQGKSLDWLTFISCNGKTKIPFYQLVCKAFGIPYYTVFDLDSKLVTENDNKQPGDCADSSALYTFTTNFEDLLGIKPNEEHKGSATLLKIDSIDVEDIPKDISDCITSIEKWAAA